MEHPAPDKRTPRWRPVPRREHAEPFIAAELEPISAAAPDRPLPRQARPGAEGTPAQPPQRARLARSTPGALSAPAKPAERRSSSPEPFSPNTGPGMRLRPLATRLTAGLSPRSVPRPARPRML